MYPNGAILGDQQKVEDFISHGMRLFIPFDGSAPKLLPTMFNEDDKREFFVSKEVAKKISIDSRFRKLSKNRIGGRQSYVMGWKELGLPGDIGNLYSFMQ